MWLEHYGWRKDIAGDDDFRKACLAVQHYRKDRKNGLLLIGEVGCGKTLLARILFNNTKWRRHSEDTIDHRVWVDCTDSLEVNRLASDEDARQLGLVKPAGGDDDWLRPILFIDDLGRERPVNNYGTQVSLTGAAIQRFYNSWEQPYDERFSGPPTIGNHLVVTTNLDLGALHERYGTRVMDRMLAMCAIVRFTGGSKRKAVELS